MALAVLATSGIFEGLMVLQEFIGVGCFYGSSGDNDGNVVAVVLLGCY